MPPDGPENSGPTDACPDGASAVLLFDDGGSDGGCVDLPAGDDTAVLRIAVESSVDDVLGSRQRHAGRSLPDRGCVISLGTATRSAAASDGGTVSVADGVTVEALPDTADLADLGVAASDRLATWEDSDCRPAVRIDSLGGLVERAGLERTFRFLHVLFGQVDRAGATVHCHVDPGAADRETIAAVIPLFDAVVDPRPDAARVVRPPTTADVASLDVPQSDDGNDVEAVGLPFHRIPARLGVTHDGVVPVFVGGLTVLLTLAAAILVFRDQYGLGLAALSLAALNALLIAAPLRE